jgi:dTDP-L-rhamnose 4-epimerase
VLAAMESPAANGQVINIGSGIGRPIADVAADLARLTGRALLSPDITYRYRSGDIRHCTADLTRARELLNFQPQVSWDSGLAEVVEWARSTPSVDRVAQADRELEARGLVTDRRPVAEGPTA